MIAAKHPRERERLLALRSYGILDTDPEAEFDEIAQLAARLCDVPVALVNFVDADEQFVKAATGMDVRTMPLPQSICAHGLLVEDFLEIPDTLADPRTADNPLCCGEPDMRFYAGALISSREGLPLGALCVLDRRLRTLTPLQRDALRVLARQVMARLDLRRSLAVAETLRLEVDHRVKNSLQSLTALIGLKARGVESPDAREVLDSVTQNIRTVSMLHELLYRTDAGAEIDLGRFIGNVVEFLSTVAPPTVRVVAEIGPEPVVVSSRRAAGIGTLVNEVAANAFKHAFPDGREGTVRIALSLRGEGDVLLTCSDDGVGPPEGYDGGKGLGMRLIAAVAGQLGGTVTHGSGNPGMRLDIAFPLAPEEPAAPQLRSL